MATFQKFNSFVEACAEKVHNLGSDTLMVALCASANAPVATNSTLANLTQVAYTYCSSRALARTSSAQTGGVYKLILEDLTLTATGGAVGPFRYAVIYNDTATNKELIGFYDYGADTTLNAGETMALDFDQVNGLIQLS